MNRRSARGVTVEVNTMDNARALWQQALEHLKKDADGKAIESLAGDRTTCVSADDAFIYILVPDKLAKFRLDRFYKDSLNDFLHSKSDEHRSFCFITQDDLDAKAQKEKASASPATQKIESPLPLSKEYTFDNFETGESNRLAVIAAMKVAAAKEDFVIPLYIFGDVGLGKTHLMQAIGHYVLADNPSAVVIYTSAQQFAEEYFLATSTPRGRETIQSFYDRYQKADLLLVDDIQFMEGKKNTQAEFFKAFEMLAANKKKIVMTSDRPASELKVMPRLVSRFNWGLAVDIKAPDKALRVSILRRKLSFMVERPEEVPDAVLSLIADYFTANVRELEGALRRYVVYCTSLGLPFTTENVYTSLDRLFPKELKEDPDDPLVLISKVTSAVTSYFHLAAGDISSDSRKKSVAYARQLTMYLLKTKYRLTLKTIGDSFGNRDHATVAYSISKIERGKDADPLVQQDITNILHRLDPAS